VKLRRKASSRHIRSVEAESVAAGLWSSGFFDSVTASRGEASRWAVATVVENPTRDIEHVPIAYDGRLRARSKGWGVIMDVDIFRLSLPSTARSESMLTPSAWVAARLTLDERPSFEHLRLSEVPGLVGACFWMRAENLRAGGFARRVEQLVKEALSGHAGPYR
jgi:hypothetical protein